MFDTISFRLPQDRVQDKDLLSEVSCRLTTLKDTITNHQTGLQTITGWLGGKHGLEVKVNECQVSITKGSLCKWYFGNNIQTMTRGDVQDAITRLSEALDLPMDKANVTRLDIGTNLAVNYPVSVYLHRLGELSRYKRQEQQESLYYNQDKKQIVFYDKMKEYHKHKPLDILPTEVQPLTEGNLLRFEMRCKSRLPQLFGLPAVTGSTLYDVDFFNKAITMWHNVFMSIQKINDVCLDSKIMVSIKEINRAGIAFMVQELGMDKILHDIADAQQKGELTKEQACRARRVIREASSLKGGVTITNNDIKELNQKMQDAVEAFSC